MSRKEGRKVRTVHDEVRNPHNVRLPHEQLHAALSRAKQGRRDPLQSLCRGSAKRRKLKQSPLTCGCRSMPFTAHLTVVVHASMSMQPKEASDNCRPSCSRGRTCVAALPACKPGSWLCTSPCGRLPRLLAVCGLCAPPPQHVLRRSATSKSVPASLLELSRRAGEAPGVLWGGLKAACRQ